MIKLRYRSAKYVCFGQVLHRKHGRPTCDRESATGVEAEPRRQIPSPTRAIHTSPDHTYASSDPLLTAQIDAPREGGRPGWRFILTECAPHGGRLPFRAGCPSGRLRHVGVLSVSCRCRAASRSTLPVGVWRSLGTCRAVLSSWRTVRPGGRHGHQRSLRPQRAPNILF